jgi:hypothetical protein
MGSVGAKWPGKKAKVQILVVQELFSSLQITTTLP